MCVDVCSSKMVDGEVAMNVVVERRVLQVTVHIRSSRSRLASHWSEMETGPRRQHPRKETELLTNPVRS